MTCATSSVARGLCQGTLPTLWSLLRLRRNRGLIAVVLALARVLPRHPKRFPARIRFSWRAAAAVGRLAVRRAALVVYPWPLGEVGSRRCHWSSTRAARLQRGWIGCTGCHRWTRWALSLLLELSGAARSVLPPAAGLVRPLSQSRTGTCVLPLRPTSFAPPAPEDVLVLNFSFLT